MSEAVILVVTSAGAPSSAVVPVLAAIEAAGMRVRAIDLGGVGGGGGGVADRVRRALLGEGAERRLKRELEISSPDAAVVFDPHAAVALTLARDQAQNPAPVIAVVDDLEPGAAWAQTDADRFVAIDELAAVALADAGVEGDRILVVGAIGERAFADAGGQDRAALRARFKLGARTALVEVTGLGAEQTGQLALQLSLLDGGDRIMFLFDAAGDVDSAAVLRRQVPALGLRAKLFGTTTDAPLLWRAADVILARPRPEVVARVQLVGGKLVALIDDSIASGAKAAAALESRKRAIPAKGLLLLSSALDSAFTGPPPPPPTADGGDNIADIVAAIAGDKRGVIDERRVAAHAATRDRVRAASASAKAAAATTAMPGELEDLSGGTVVVEEDVAPLPDAAELARLRAEVERRKVEMTGSMMAARDSATTLNAEAAAARAGGKTDEATQLDRRADAERARMHSLLAELAQLETELAELERVRKTIQDAPRRPRASATSSSASSSSSSSTTARAPRQPSIDDALSEMKRKAGTSGGQAAPKPSSSSSSSSSSSRSSSRARGNVDDELAALKKKMTNAPPKKKG